MTPNRDAEMRAKSDAIELDIALGKLSAPAVFTKMRDLLNLALLTRAEAAQVWDGADWKAECLNEQERSQMLDDLCTANARALFRAMNPGASDDEVEYEHSHDIIQQAVRALTHPQDASGDAAKLGAFAASILNLDEDWIGDVDGGTLQDAAEKHGLLQAVEVTEACGEGCNCAGYGDFPQTCYRPTDTMKRAMQAKESK